MTPTASGAVSGWARAGRTRRARTRSTPCLRATRGLDELPGRVVMRRGFAVAVEQQIGIHGEYGGDAVMRSGQARVGVGKGGGAASRSCSALRPFQPTGPLAVQRK